MRENSILFKNELEIENIASIKRDKRPIVYAKDLDEAYEFGYFSGSMSAYELMARITKYNPSLRWHSYKRYRGLWDTARSAYSYICGVPYFNTMPKFTIMKLDTAKSRKLHYCMEDGTPTSSEVINTDNEEYKVLARGWPVILDIVKRKSYEIY